VSQVLEVLASRVGCFHEHEDAGVAFDRRADEWLERVDAEIGIDGERVGLPPAGEPAVGVGFGGGADVTALAVGEDEQVFTAGVEDHLAQGRHAVDRHERRDHVDHVAAEAGVDRGEVLGVGGGGGPERRRKLFDPRIEADAGGGPPGDDRGREAEGEGEGCGVVHERGIAVRVRCRG